jgi:uncharacterized membrane protein
MIAATLALIGFFVSLYLSLWKLGLMGMMACGTGSCERVQLSPYAYLFGIPVAFFGVVGYLAIFGVSILGLQPRFANERWVVAALIAVTGAGVAFTGYLSYLEAFIIDAWCRWCLISAALILGTFISSLFGLKTPATQRDAPATV